MPKPVADLYGADGTGSGYCGAAVEEGGIVGATLAIIHLGLMVFISKKAIGSNFRWPSHFN
jgi:hypothetical protein